MVEEVLVMLLLRHGGGDQISCRNERGRWFVNCEGVMWESAVVGGGVFINAGCEGVQRSWER